MLQQHVHQLDEIKSIMNSMKNLAFLEIHKLENISENQQQSVKDIEAAAGDLLHFYPDILPKDGGGNDLSILFGSERGFCGDFNSTLQQHFEYGSYRNDQLNQTNTEHLVIPVGHKLCTKFEDDPRVVAFIDGASVGEEITPVLVKMIEQIGRLQEQYPFIDIFTLYHNLDGSNPVSHQLIPPFNAKTKFVPEPAWPPMVNIEPQALMLDLIEHYLFVVLHEIANMSFIAENYTRIRHIEQAVHHLEETSQSLMHQYHAIYQEEITEELEIILLNAVEPTTMRFN